jgi:DNA-binding response OmpR family regulator
MATRSAVPRYVRPLTGRSSEPGRGRLGAGGGRRAAICRGYSREGRSAAPIPGGDAPVPDSSTILLVDDEDSVQKLLAYPLEREGFRVLQAWDGEEALERFAQERVDLVVLDIMLPKLDGLEVCRRLRAESEVPIIMLTARDDELDKVVGLELGADDYITKPFSIREFRSRVRALLRRAAVARQTSSGDEVISADGLRIDVPRRSVRVRGEPVQLTYVEFELLRTLASNPGRVYSRRMLLESLWGDADYREPRTIDVHVRHLREKLERDPAEPEYILTVRGVGYRFRET